MRTNRETTAAQGRPAASAPHSATVRTTVPPSPLTLARRAATRHSLVTLAGLQETACLCGAQLSEGEKACRKCRARGRWARRAAHRTNRPARVSEVND
jgi:hypothetical protein